MKKRENPVIREIESFDTYEDFIRDVSCSPVFADPHFAFDKRNLYDALNRDPDHRKAYIVTLDRSVAGLFVWLILPEERYAEMLVGLTREEAAIREMLAYIEEKCRGFQLDFVINPDNTMFSNVLRSENAEFDAPQQWMFWKNETKPPHHEVVLISSEYESQYLAVHRKDTYWTAEKVLAAKDTFRVFLALHEGKVIGYIDVTFCHEKNEPYDLWVDDRFLHQGYEQALLQKAVKMNRPKTMVSLVNIDDPYEKEIFVSAGFVPMPGTNCVHASYTA